MIIGTDVVGGDANAAGSTATVQFRGGLILAVYGWSEPPKDASVLFRSHPSGAMSAPATGLLGSRGGGFRSHDRRFLVRRPAERA